MICGDVRIHSWWAFTSLCHTCICVWHVVGSNRLWDAIENGAIPVMTDPRQYDIVPFASLWRTMSVKLDVHFSYPLAKIAKLLMAKSAEVRKQWSKYVTAVEAGKPIVSWLHPRSVTLRAYVQLLVDRIKARPCGPCLSKEEYKKAKCHQPRCIRNKCEWNLQSSLYGCSINADGTIVGAFRTVPAQTLRECQTACESDDFCNAVDFSSELKQCHLIPLPCSRPMARKFMSYSIKVHKREVYMMDHTH